MARPYRCGHHKTAAAKVTIEGPKELTIVAVFESGYPRNDPMDHARRPMTIILNHTIVPARDKVAAAHFFADTFGLNVNEQQSGHFAPVRVNETLTLLFDEAARLTVTTMPST
jgi:hypothetical protein